MTLDSRNGGGGVVRSGSAAGARAALTMIVLSMGVVLAAVGATDEPAQGGSKPRTKEAPAATVAELARDLGAARPETRRSAVRKLAELGTREAWPHVLDALDDVDSMVADEAQVRLAGLAEPQGLKLVLGPLGLQSRDELVRLRVAEALGRMAMPVPAKDLLRACSANDPMMSATCLWSLERLLDRKLVDTEPKELSAALEKFVQAPAAVRAGALEVATRLDLFAARPALDAALVARDPALRAGALLVLPRLGEVDAVEVVQRHAGDESERVRAAALSVLERYTSRPALLALVDRLEREKRTRLRWRILGRLRGLSGEDHGFDAQAWRAWAGKAVGPNATGDARARGPLGDTHATFAGLTLISDRVCFLVDLSGSMQTKVGDLTRKQHVDQKLRAALEALPEGTEFNLIPYTNDPIVWEKRLVPSTKANVKRAIEWFERCHQSGRGNFYTAAHVALEDPEVDTLCVLTDGVPTGGIRYDLDLMFELLVFENRTRQVAIDSILVDSSRSKQLKWTTLAERTGGRSIAIELGKGP